MASKRNILFVHRSEDITHTLNFHVYEYLSKSGIANAYFLTNSQTYNQYKHTLPNLLSFDVEEKIQDGYYYSSYNEDATRISLGILKTIKEINDTYHFDAIIGHYLYGSLHLLYDEVNIPLITYLEFPSFRHSQWDKQYPPMNEQRYLDKNFEMLSYYHALKSDKMIVPNYYVKKMFPESLQDNIIVIPDAHNFSNVKANLDIRNQYFSKYPNKIYIGFYARTLSSEKGFEQFLKISLELLEKDKNIQFVIIGQPIGFSYGFESLHLGKEISFKEYLFKKYSLDISKYTFLGFIDPKYISKVLSDIDIILYPLQYGSASWGFFNLLDHGKAIIASNRTSIPEIITHKENGLLCDYEDLDSWVSSIFLLKENKELRKKLEENAKITAQKYDVSKIAPHYLDLVEEVMRIKK